MYGALDISTSGMIAQRDRLAAISANLANRDSISPDGTPYRAKRVYFQVGDPSAGTADGRKLGVHIAQIRDDPSALGSHFDPSSPFAQKSGPQAGYVLESNVDPVVEQVNAMEAGRAYEANVVAAEATKAMVAQSLRLLA